MTKRQTKNLIVIFLALPFVVLSALLMREVDALARGTVWDGGVLAAMWIVINLAALATMRLSRRFAGMMVKEIVEADATTAVGAVAFAQQPPRESSSRPLNIDPDCSHASHP